MRLRNSLICQSLRQPPSQFFSMLIEEKDKNLGLQK